MDDCVLISVLLSTLEIHQRLRENEIECHIRST